MEIITDFNDTLYYVILIITFIWFSLFVLK